MITRFVEVTDKVVYGKFLVARMDAVELSTRTAMPDAYGHESLFTYSGSRRFRATTTLVVDLQRGTAAAWPLENGAIGMASYAGEKLQGIERLVCPMYLPFVHWLHLKGEWAEGAGDITTIPRYIELPPGPSSRLLDRLLRPDEPPCGHVGRGCTADECRSM